MQEVSHSASPSWTPADKERMLELGSEIALMRERLKVKEITLLAMVNRKLAYERTLVPIKVIPAKLHSKPGFNKPNATKDKVADILNAIPGLSPELVAQVLSQLK